MKWISVLAALCRVLANPVTIVTWHEKTGLTYVHKINHSSSLFYKRFAPVSCMRFFINGCIITMFVHTAFNFEIQKCGQILCAHQARSQGNSLGAEKPPFLNKRSTILLKRSTIFLKSHNFIKNILYFVKRSKLL